MSTITKLIILMALVAAVLVAAFFFGSDKDSSPGSSSVTIGAILPLTGPAAYVGEELQNGLMLAAEELRDEGFGIQLTVEDSASKPPTGVSAFQKIEQTERPDIYISALSSVSMALAPLAGDNKVPLLGLVVTAPTFTQQNEYSFRYYSTAQTEVAGVLEAIETLEGSIETVGLLYLNDDFGNGVHDTFTEVFEGQGGTVVSESYVSEETDFRTQLAKLKVADLDALFAVGFDRHLSTIYARAKELDIDAQLLGISTLSQPPLREQQAETLEGVVIAAPQVYDKNFAPAQTLVTAYEARFNRPLSHYASVAYDSLYLLAETLTGEDEITRDAIRNRLQNLDSHTGVLGDLMIDVVGREIAFPLHTACIVNGELEYLD